MTDVEILALSIGLSGATAILAYGAVRLFERGVADALIRERAWATAFYLPILPVILVVALLAAPRRVVEAAAVAEAGVSVSLETAAVAASPLIHWDQVALALLGLAAFLAMMRGAGLALRTFRLHRLIRHARPAGEAVERGVRSTSQRVKSLAPRVRLSTTGSEALVTGFWRPILVLPETLAEDPSSPAFQAVCSHELAHLKRGDHRALWLEEVVLTVLAINPMLRAIRDRRAAAREEACDALVLTHADADQRRLYARSLLDALRAPAGRDLPALTFTNNRRIFVMRRLKAVLSPTPVAGLRPRLAVLGLGVAVAAVTGIGSAALAAKREPVVVVAPVEVNTPAPVTLPVTVPTPMPAAVPVPVVEVPTPAATPVRAEPSPVTVAAEEPAVITNPSWSQHPMPRYPAVAIAQGSLGGQANLSCTVEPSARVSACRVLSEDPPGLGYGAAALEAAASARLSPRTVEGAPAGGTVQFSIRFNRQE